MNKLLYIIVGIYVLLYCTVFSGYNLPPKATPIVHTLFDIQWYIPLILFIPLYIAKASKLLDKITNVKYWNYVCYVVLAACIATQLMGIPGFWWSWMTIGLLFSVLILIMNLTKGKVRSNEGFLLGCGCVLIVMSMWEMTYQLGHVFYHGHSPLNYLLIGVWNSIWTITGAILVLEVLRRYKGLIHINKAFVLCLAIFIAFHTTWFFMGAPTIWRNPEHETTVTSLTRVSKAFFCLAPVMLLIPARKK